MFVCVEIVSSSFANFSWMVIFLQAYFPLAIELTRANSSRDAKIKIVLTRNQMSMNLTYWTRETLSFIFLCRFMKVNQLAVPGKLNQLRILDVQKRYYYSTWHYSSPRVVLPGAAIGSSQNDTQLMATSNVLGM